MSRPTIELPETATQFLRTLEPTHKKNSLKGYRTALRSFHRWLDDNGIPLKKIERKHTSAWLIHLSGTGNVPKSINHKTIFIRIYLRWLFEQGIIENYPDDLIRVSDHVKEPKYLPRPLPPAADKELQERLATSESIYHQGLLLMRRTGLRIGELISLEKDCIRNDHLGNQFLKVPLGKLNNERLVPIDDLTISLIDKLRGNDAQAASKSFLIETPTGKKTRYIKYVEALAQACQGLNTGGKMVTHRMRHSFATTLLNAGMSLVGVMKLLGHNDHRMTLRYSEITQETVNKEYFEALSRLEHRYIHVLNDYADDDFDPIKALDDIMHLIQNHCADDNTMKTFAATLVKRIRRIQADIQKLFLQPIEKP